MPTLHALLVGINEYPLERHRLRGCIPDLRAVQAYLQRNFSDLRLHTLTDAEATRAAVIAEFEHFNEAKPGDACLFFYSGHGSQAPAPKEFWTESDGLNESLVLHDSRLPGGRDLMDKELAYLIWKVTQGKDLHFLALMDCCHAGHGTRDLRLGEADVTVRMAEPSFTPTALEDYLGYHDYPRTQHPDGRIELAAPLGEHLVLAASKNYQTAKEKLIDGQSHGVFTHALLSTLEARGGRVSYAELVQQVTLRAAQLVPDQAPQLETSGGTDARMGFLGNGATPGDTWLLGFENEEWSLNAGTVQNLRLGDSLQLADEPGSLTLESVEATRSLVSGTEALDPAKSYRVRHQPSADRNPRLAPAPGSDPAALNAFRAEATQPGHAFRFGEKADDAAYLVRTDEGKLSLTRAGETARLFAPVSGGDAGAALDFARKTDTVLKWQTLLELGNPATQLRDSDLTLEWQRVLPLENSGAKPNDASPAESTLNPTEPLRSHYLYRNGAWEQPFFRLKLSNTSDRTLHVSALYLSQDFGVANVLLPYQELAAGEVTWLSFGDKKHPVSRTIPLNVWPNLKEFESLGINEMTEYLKILVATEPFTTNHFNQDGIGLAALKKGFGFADQPLPDWTARTLTLRIVGPTTAVTLQPDRPATIHQLIVKPHPTLKAQVTLSSAQDATRSASGMALRAFFDESGTSELLSFAPDGPARQRGLNTTPALNVVELVNVENAETVTPENPLDVDLSALLGSGETALAVGLDAETGLFFPLGVADEGVLRIGQLPDTSAINERSLGGSIKLFFKKIFHGSAPTGALSWVEVAEDETVTRIRDDAPGGIQKITEAVRNAKRVVVFIHGIIGDTDDMVKIMRRVRLPGGDLTTRFDVALAFDYENLDTTIEATAQRLKDALAAVGIGPDDDREVTLLVHSMGGLVSRWFIEKLEGHRVVDRLVMLGTPNIGSEWSDVEALVTTLTTYVVNGSSLMKPWLAPVVRFLGKQADRLFNTLGQMKSDSEFMQRLNDGATGAGIPYLIVAGNTQLIPVVFQQNEKLLRKVWLRFRNRGIYQLLDVLLFKNPNDIAAEVASIHGVEGGHVTKITPVACNHLTYFTDADSLVTLGEVL